MGRRAGDAWEGADRTLLYLLVLRPVRLLAPARRRAALLLGAWTLALIALAAFAALHVDSAAAAGLRAMLPAGASYPTKADADAAQMADGLLAGRARRSERLPWGLRGVLAGGAVLLAEVALLGGPAARCTPRP